MELASGAACKAARPARGAEGSNGFKPFVPEAGEKKGVLLQQHSPNQVR